MMRAKSFRDLQVWQRGILLVTHIYRATTLFPSEERFGLTVQKRRAAVSVPSNIAEGFGRTSRKDFRNFVLIARGSLNELQTQLVIAQRLHYADANSLTAIEQECMDLGRMLQRLAERLLLQPKQQAPPSGKPNN